MISRTSLSLILALILASCGPSVSGKSSKDAAEGIATTAGGLAGLGGLTTGTGEPTGAGATTDGQTTAGGATTGAGAGTSGEGICPPSGLACDGTALVQCNADGSAWQVIQQCAANETCNATNGTCSCSPSCFGKQCGDDGCGGTCGNCAAGQSCNEQNACVSATDPGPGPVSSNCVANGTGVNVGQKVKDIVWNDSNGQPLSLHSFCGTAPATFLIESAGW